MLRLNRDVQRFLISTTSKLEGEYDTEDLLITHSFQVGMPNERLIESPYSRNYFMVSVVLQDPGRGVGLVLPRLSIEPLLVCLSVLYGKRFDYHGPVEQYGAFRVPTLASDEPNVHPKIGFNSHQPRSNFGVGLDLSQLEIMRPVFDDDSGVDPRVQDFFFTAGNFYLQALQRYGTHPESAYLDLITCGEILSNFYTYSEEEMYDDALLKQFETIAKIEGGGSIVRNLKQRLFQVSRKFSRTLMGLLTHDFCENSEVIAAEKHFAELEEEMLEKRIKAAYQVRSMYVHTGKRFGQQIQHERWERDPGIIYRPELRGAGEDVKKFYKALQDAPTFKGLERMMRFCLLRFLETNGVITFSIEEPKAEKSERI